MDLLREDKKNISTLQNALASHLKKMAADKDLDLSLRDPEVMTGEPQILVRNLGLLRLGSMKGSAAYSLGSADAAFSDVWKKICEFSATPALSAPNSEAQSETTVTAAPPKSPEFELMRSFFAALDAIVKTSGFQIDPKNSILQEGENLGDWSEILVEQTLRLPIGTKFGDLNFDVPLISGDFSKTRTLEQYGFKDNARMLVVDDSLVARKSSRGALAMAGFTNIDEAADGQLALAKVMGSHPRFELVVADWHMPNLSGIEMLKKIRSMGEFKKLPVILVTGEKKKEEVINAIREGVTSYLVKPVSQPGFLKALKKAGGRA